MRADDQIWKYGDVEFIFSERRSGLRAVHVHHFLGDPGLPTVSACPMEARGWYWIRGIIRKRLPRRELERALRREGIPHQVIALPRLRNGMTLWDDGEEVRMAVGPGAAVVLQRSWRRFAPPTGLVLIETRTDMY